jgi:hypothetical protein
VRKRASEGTGCSTATCTHDEQLLAAAEPEPTYLLGDGAMKTLAKLSAAGFVAAMSAAIALATPAQALKFDWEWGGDADCIKLADQSATWTEYLAKSRFFDCEAKHGRIACTGEGDASTGYELTPRGCDTSLARNTQWF